MPTDQHLVEDGAEAPDVDLGGVRLAFEHLGRHVERCAGKRLRKDAMIAQLLSEAEITDLEDKVLDGWLSISVLLGPSDENILELDVAVNDLVLVEVRQALGDLSNNVARIGLAKRRLSIQAHILRALWLEVALRDLRRVRKLLTWHHQLVASLRLVEAANERAQVALGAVLEEEEECLACLRGSYQLDDLWAAQALESFGLILELGDALFLFFR